MTRIAPFVVACLLLLAGCMTDHNTPPQTQPGGWRTVAGLTGTPQFLVTINGKLYAGLASQDPADEGKFRRLVSYDPVTGAATEQQPFPGAALGEFSYFVLNNKLYVGLGTAPGLDPSATFELVRHNSEVYAYDPAADRWQPVPTPMETGQLSYLARGATSLTYNNRGLVLYGVYRRRTNGSQQANAPGGIAYTDGQGWGSNSLHVTEMPPFPEPPVGNTGLVARYRVFRVGGFGFTLNNRVYTGGGQLFRSSAVPEIPDAAETLARDLWAFGAAETGDGKGLNLTLQERLKTPSAEIDLTGSSQAFTLNNKAYIITRDGGLLTFTPGEWKKLTGVPDGLRFGAGLGNKAYFIGQNQLLEYTPE